MLNIAKGRRAFIYRTIKRYNETGDTNDKPRSGRPCSVRTAALKKRKEIHFLSELVKTKLLLRSKALLARHATGGLENIIFTDEKIFIIAEATNVQNDRVISTVISEIPDMFRYISRKMKLLSVMIWARVSAVGRTPLIFVPAGVKINAKTYKDLILEPVVKDLSQTMFFGQPFVFQQDGAPAHTAITTQDWLDGKIPDFIRKE
ncbi:MhmaT1 transposase [Oopsacas minuta]|uniref:MhmaT1 transposase n=1 Tax=Oopsacas minuta TaxID=111878 RepID=A0AAV7JN14_9METZ|nr:MhmaT1 transposase [Oopsacas minuta]